MTTRPGKRPSTAQRIRRPRVAGQPGRTGITSAEPAVDWKPSPVPRADKPSPQPAKPDMVQEIDSSTVPDPVDLEVHVPDSVVAERNPSPTTDFPVAAPNPGRRRGWSVDEWLAGPIGLVRGALLGVAVLGLLGAVWAGVGAAELRGSASAGNAALADAASTQDVSRQISDAIASAFSYDYTDLGRTQTSATRVLTGSALRQFGDLFRQVTNLAPAQKATMTTTVRSVGVTELRGETATALVLVDQQIVRGDHEHGSGSAALTIHAHRSGSDWKITDIQFE